MYATNLGNTVEVPNLQDNNLTYIYQHQFVLTMSLPGRWYCSSGELLLAWNDARNAGETALATEIINSNAVTGVSGAAITNWNGETAVGIASTCSNAVYGEAVNTTTLRLTGQRIRDVENTLNVQVLTTR